MRTPLTTFTALAALAAFGVLVTGCGGSDDNAKPVNELRAEIVRTAHGIPHVTADTPAGLAYGVGHAQAADGICGLARQFAVVQGQAARHFGAGEPDVDAGGLPAHVASDIFFGLLNDEAAVAAALAAQSPEARALIRGWVAGYNRWLREAQSRLPADCSGQAWVRELAEPDLVRLLRYYATLNDVGYLAPLLAQAEPGGATAQALPTRLPARTTASNALALGKDGSDNGRGLLLGNPHFPWQAPLRMMALHARIPGRIDAMGATLPGIPVVAIGFNASFAWSHTTNTSAHGTAYRLELDPADPTRYVVDGSSRAMEKRSLRIAVREADGRLAELSREVYTAGEFGWLLAWEGRGSALSYRSANIDNHRMLDEWWGINLAKSLAEVRAHVQRNVGNPWNNLLAADREGRTLMLTVSPVPRVDAARFADCRLPGYEAWERLGVTVLAARGDCRWSDDPAAPQRGIFAGAALPAIERSDFVHNANDSAWLANPAAPQTGYSPLVSLDSLPLDPRPRHGLQAVTAALAGGGRLSFAEVQALVMSNRVPLAERLLPDLLAACAGVDELATACQALAAWDRTANLDAGIGYGYFEAFATELGPVPEDGWRQPFDPARPLTTPAGLRGDDPAVRDALRATLARAAASVDAGGLWQAGRRWGDIQRATRGSTSLPVHGGSDLLGVYNAMESAAVPGTTTREVIAGTSWLQVVGFDADGPRAQAVLAYSQQQDPAAPHSADQTALFSAKRWVSLPFTAAQIAADPARTRIELR